jgi:hypothetical protein
VNEGRALEAAVIQQRSRRGGSCSLGDVATKRALGSGEASGTGA